MRMLEIGPPDGRHYHSHLGSTRHESPPRLGDRRRYPPDAARTAALERIRHPPVGHRRLSRAMVRRLSCPQPLDRLRPLPPFWRELLFLAQPGDPGAGDDVDPAGDATRLWP